MELETRMLCPAGHVIRSTKRKERATLVVAVENDRPTAVIDTRNHMGSTLAPLFGEEFDEVRLSFRSVLSTS